jgi:2-polyprenyl-6-methoxyphenol hydroxylase-like FAD-dependent oxidoreductase
MNKLRILISGASIAGPAAALLLARQGHAVTVVERAPGLREGGQTVDLRGAGRTVIERMGLTAATDARLLRQRGFALVDARGRRRAEVPVTAFDGNGIVSSREILRGDLAAVLFRACPPGVEFRWGDTVTALTEDHDGVTAEFETGAPQRFDLVVGADGLGSAVRRAGFGPDSDYLDPIDLRYAWFTAELDAPIDGWFLMHTARGGRVVSVRPDRVPGRVKAGLAIRGFDGAAPRDRDAQWRMFEEQFADLGWLTPRLLTAMRTADDFAYADLARVRMDRFVTGRIALVGDAGYSPTPLTGLGTTLALVGAYVLAGSLAQSDGAVSPALDHYQSVLRPFVATAQRLPPGGATGFAPRSRPAIAMGAWSYRAMTTWPFDRMLAPLFTKADGIDLPDYATPGCQSGSISVMNRTNAR